VLLVAGFVANLLIRPLDKKWFMSEEEVTALQAKLKSRVEGVTSALGSGGFDIRALLAWARRRHPARLGHLDYLAKGISVVSMTRAATNGLAGPSRRTG